MIHEITVQELATLKKTQADFFLLDVRNQNEFDFCNLGGHLIPMNDLPKRLNELKKEQHIVIHCHAGGRSRRATEFLMQQGFLKVSNLKGGITAWATEIDTTMPTY